MVSAVPVSLQQPTATRGETVPTVFRCCLIFHLILFALTFNAFGVETGSPKAEAVPADSRHTPTATFDCNRGPWGDLEYVRITLEPPDHYALESLDYVKGTHWFFKDHSRERLTNYFKSLTMEPSQMDSLLRAEWRQTTNGIWVTPGEDLVLRMDKDVRTKLYALLASFDENGFCHTPFVFRSEMLTERFSHSGLSEKTIDAVKSLMYPKGSLVAFSDIAAVMSMIHDPQEKIHLVKVLSRKSTLMLRLKLTEKSDVPHLLEYWGAGGRAKDLKPLLESLTRVDGGWEIDVAHLLPPFARKRLYTYPSPAKNQTGPSDNCHWTSFNFFSDPTDDRFRDSRQVQKAIDEDYDVVTGDKHFGDVVLLMDSANSILHSAVHIADDIVFTKTGGRENQPWILMKTDDMLPLYASANQSLKMVVCRKKPLQESPSVH
ncbi:MAG: hypothetical protein JWM68_3466 [Verrucomicrobiales bacterium]|nr:hypothetical protein [Verrucomicrobiales bacterium]